MIIVTGGAGFIGSCFVRRMTKSHPEFNIIAYDKMTYAGNMDNLLPVSAAKNFQFVQGDIADREGVMSAYETHDIDTVVNFAAESHVDRSILSPDAFINSNTVGVHILLESAQKHGIERFLHVSTDEVYGDIEANHFSVEDDPFKPNSPYSASKASSDHLVRAYYHTYGLPVLTTNCSNNYGPFHFPEKLIPLVLLNALKGQPLPIYGDGSNVRDWLYVRDHCSAIERVLEAGRPGETYNIGGCNEKTNLQVVETLCAILDELSPRQDGHSYREQITYVKDRPGHDQRYAIDASKIGRELGWSPAETFESGIRKTVIWYLENPDWVAGVTSGAYREWIAQQYGSQA